MEIAITIFIIATAGYILFKNIKRKSSGGCDCGSCSKSSCCHHKK